MTIQDQITSLKNAIATGAKSVTVGDRSIVYRDTDEMFQALAMLEKQLSQSSGSTVGPFTLTYINSSKGL